MLSRQGVLPRPSRYQSHKFAELIHTNQKSIMPINFRQVRNKIHRPLFKFSSGNRQRLQQASRLQVHVLGPLANCTTTHKTFNRLMQLRPPYSLLERFNRFTHSQVSRVSGVVQFSQKQLAQPTPTRYDKLKHIVLGFTIDKLKTMHIPKAEISIISLGGGQVLFHFIIRRILL